MDKKAEFQRKLLAVFQDELQNHVQVLTQGLLKMEQTAGAANDPDFLAGLFRAAHSLKGAARGVGIDDIAQIAHKLEDILAAIQHQKLAPTPTLIDQTLPALDTLQEAFEAHLQEKRLPPGQLDDLIRSLDAASQPKPSAGEDFAANPAIHLQASGESDTGQNPNPAETAAPKGREGAYEDITRVETAKLNDVLDRLGELLVVRIRSEQFEAEIRTLKMQINQWDKDWRRVRHHYNRLARQATPQWAQDLNPLLSHLANSEHTLKSLQGSLENLSKEYRANQAQLNLVSNQLQEDVHRLRMLPVAHLFDNLPRTARDIARAQNKQVWLKIEGADTEIDRQILEIIKDPLIQLVRNAVDHGIETPDLRQKAGKPVTGTIWLGAAQLGDIIQIKISDDGAGINCQEIIQKAIDIGILSSQDASNLNEAQTLDLIFVSGLSTSKIVTEVSGRGIGMDVVRAKLEQLRGLIQIDNRPGRGTTFTLTLPLTLAISQVLLVTAGEETLAIPTTNIDRILHIAPAAIKSVDRKAVIYAEEQPVPLFNLAQILKLPESNPAESKPKIPVVIINVVEKRIALVVDSFVGHQEVVIKSLGQQLKRVVNIAGATILGDGQVVMVLNAADLIKTIKMQLTTIPIQNLTAPTPHRNRILVVDDSITTRTLEKNILENAGFQVIVAADGQEALTLIQTETLDVVVTDVAMPRMDGIALTQAIKSQPRTADLPVIIVTSLNAAEDKIRGMEVGADAYITKGSFDQYTLLETIERLIE